MSVEYPALAMTRACELRGYGLKLEEIRDEIAREFGRRPTTNTVNRWTNANVREKSYAHMRRRRARSRAQANGGRMLPRMRPTDEFKLARMVALDGLGVSAADIATVMTFDLGEPISRFQVRRPLETGRYPKLRKAATVPTPRAEDPDIRKWIEDGVIS